MKRISVGLVIGSLLLGLFHVDCSVVSARSYPKPGYVVGSKRVGLKDGNYLGKFIERLFRQEGRNIQAVFILDKEKTLYEERMDAFIRVYPVVRAFGFSCRG